MTKLLDPSAVTKAADRVAGNESTKEGRVHQTWFRGSKGSRPPKALQMMPETAVLDYVLKGWMPPERSINENTKVTAFGSCFAAYISDWLASRHYKIHQGKPFYEPLVEFITSGPVVVAVIEGTDAIDTVRKTMGATNPSQAEPGTIRADYGLEIGRNLVHGSDGPDTAAYEIPLFFADDEILSYERAIDGWINE